MTDTIPRVVQVSVTDRCQCACRHCGVALFRKKDAASEPSLGRLRTVFADLKKCGCSKVDLFGGEPTLRKDLFSVVELAKSFGFDVYVETNGLLVDAAYARRLKSAGLDLVCLSLDGHGAEAHDRSRGVKGAFAGAVRALKACKAAGIAVHVSMTAKDPAFFTSGDMNKFAEFCLKNGAEKIRILFPSCVGNWARNKLKGPTRKQELGVFSYVDRIYHDYMYVEAMGHNESLSVEAKCPAKSIFCHITTDGLVLPCPYLPLAFGDIKKESLLSIFARIQSHPVIRGTGAGCPSRNKGFVKASLGGLSSRKPYALADCDNKVNLEGGCNNRCAACPDRGPRRPAREVLKRLRAIDRNYSAVDIYGGEPMARKDIFNILDNVPANFGINLYSNARAFTYPELARRLAGYKINCVKVPVFSCEPRGYEAYTRVKGSFVQMTAGVKNLCAAGVPVSLYLPAAEKKRNWRRLTALGVSSVSAYTLSAAEPLKDSVLCFGRGIGELRVLWVRS